MTQVCSRFPNFVKMKDFACAFECMSDDPVAFQDGFRNGSAATKISFHPAKLKAAEGVRRGGTRSSGREDRDSFQVGALSRSRHSSIWQQVDGERPLAAGRSSPTSTSAILETCAICVSYLLVNGKSYK